MYKSLKRTLVQLEPWTDTLHSATELLNYIYYNVQMCVSLLQICISDIIKEWRGRVERKKENNFRWDWCHDSKKSIPPNLIPELGSLALCSAHK